MTLRTALLLLAAVWCVLLLGGGAATVVGSDGAALASFTAATALVWWSRGGRRSGTWRKHGAAWGAGLLAGFAILPELLSQGQSLAGLLGVAAPWVGDLVPKLAGSPALWVATLGLAPVWEERLYRQQVLGALQPHIGAVGAVALSSLLFALPHIQPWMVLGTFVTGLGLGALMLTTGSLALCMGLHAGLNLAVWVYGVPPCGCGSPGLLGAVAGVLVLAVAVLALRRQR